MCVKQVLQWVGIIPKPQKAPAPPPVPKAPPVQRMQRQAASLAENERLDEGQETGKEKLKTKEKQRGFTDPRDALKALGAQSKKPVKEETLPTSPEGGITTPGVS